MSEETPKFGSMEEMMEWLESRPKVKEADAEASKPKPKKKSTKKKGAKKVAPPPDTTAPVEEDSTVWSVVHFYTRGGTSPQATLRDAKEERDIRNDNVIVAYHDHSYGVECSKNCRSL